MILAQGNRQEFSAKIAPKPHPEIAPGVPARIAPEITPMISLETGEFS